LRVIAARVDGSRPYTEPDLSAPVALVLGSEAAGLSPEWQGEGVEAVRLPMHGLADSLNVSVAAAVLLYEARRQRDVVRPTNPGRDGSPARNDGPNG
jgi:TrmH family RNA methyltransferase